MASFAAAVKTNTESRRGTDVPFIPVFSPEHHLTWTFLGIWHHGVQLPPVCACSGWSTYDRSIDLLELGSFNLSRVTLILKELEGFYASLDTVDQRLRNDSPEFGLNTEYGE